MRNGCKISSRVFCYEGTACGPQFEDWRQRCPCWLASWCAVEFVTSYYLMLARDCQPSPGVLGRCSPSDGTTILSVVSVLRRKCRRSAWSKDGEAFISIEQNMWHLPERNGHLICVVKHEAQCCTCMYVNGTLEVLEAWASTKIETGISANFNSFAKVVYGVLCVEFLTQM